MIAKFLSDNEVFEFTKPNENLLQAITDIYFSNNVHSLLSRYYEQGKNKYISKHEVQEAEKALLLQRAVDACCDTFMFSFADPKIVDMTLEANLNLVKKICKEVKIPHELPLFIIAKRAVNNNKDSAFLEKLKSHGLNYNSVFLFDMYNKRNEKLINKALNSGNIDVFKTLLNTEILNTDPGALTSIPLTPEHPLLEENSESGFLSYYFIPDINKAVALNYKNGGNVKMPNASATLEEWESFFSQSTPVAKLFDIDIASGKYDNYLKQDNLDNLLLSAFIDIKEPDEKKCKKFFKEVISAFKEKGISISPKQKEAILYILIHEDSLYEGMLPWKLNIHKNKALVALLEKLEILPKDQINGSKTKALVGTYNDDLIFNYMDDFKDMIKSKDIRDLIETSMLSSVMHCIYNLTDKKYSPVTILNEFFSYPLFKILSESEYKISQKTMNALKKKFGEFSDSNKSLQESISILSENLDSIIYNPNKQPTAKKRL